MDALKYTLYIVVVQPREIDIDIDIDISREDPFETLLAAGSELFRPTRRA